MRTESNKPATSSPLVQAVRGALLVMAAAWLAGVAYNRVSPLGIRPPRPTVEMTAATSLATATRVAGSPYGGATTGLAWLTSTKPAGRQPPNLSSNAPLPVVTWEQIKNEAGRGEVLLVDARLGAQFLADHIPGAVSLPLTASEAELNRFAATHGRAKGLVIYCSNADCPMAERLGHLLVARFAYRNVRVLDGGYAAYRQALGKSSPSEARADEAKAGP